MLLEHDTAGDPITGLKWTRKTTEKIADVLRQVDIPVSANTVSRLLYQMDFSLQVNRKQIATNSSPYRDQQFQHISSLRTRFQRQGLPIISVDSKKRELIGNFKNAGAKWDRSPVLVNDHDFPSDASGVGISYGIYDPPNNRGTVCVGSPTAFTIRPTTAAQSALESPTTRRPSLLIPSPLGGNAKDRVAMSVLPSFWSWPTQVAATVALPGLGKLESRRSCAMHSASPSPSLTTPPAPPNGIPSSIVYSPRSPRTGLPSHC